MRSDGLIVLGRIEGEMPQHLTLFRQDPDVEISHEHDHLPVLVRPPEADVMQRSLVPQCHRSAPVDAVPAHPRPFRQVDLRPDRPCLVSRLIRGERRHAAAGPMGADLVVVGDERVDLGL